MKQYALTKGHLKLFMNFIIERKLLEHNNGLDLIYTYTYTQTGYSTVMGQVLRVIQLTKTCFLYRDVGSEMKC